MADLKKEFEFYQANKGAFLRDYPGKFIAIKGNQVIGVYDDRMEAINETRKDHDLGTFIVQHVTEAEDQVRFHSRYTIKHA